MKSTSKILILILILGCGRDFENPVDSIIFLNAPKGFNLSQYQDNIRVSWTSDAQFETGYQIERKSSSAPYKVVALVSDKHSESYIDTTVVTGIDYQYRIQGVADENKSAYMGPRSFKAEFPAPTELSADFLSVSSIRLRWKDNCTFENGYSIERRTGTSGDWLVVGQTLGNTFEFIDQNLVYNIYYTYRVRAFTQRNHSDYSASNITKIFMEAPDYLSVNPISDHEMRISWKDNTSLDEGVKIERMENDNYQWHQVGWVTKNFTQFVDDSLKTNTKYTYRVKAFSGNYESAYSTYADGSVAFPAPVDLKVESVSQFSARLNWKDNYNFESGFAVKYVREGSMDTAAVNLPANTTDFLIDDISRDYSYFVQVYAFTDFNISNVVKIWLEYKEVYGLNQTLSKNESVVNCLKFSPNGSLLAAGDSENQVSVFETNTWNHINNIPGDTAASADGVSSLSFAVDFPWLAIGNKNGSIRIINTNSMDEINRLYLNSYPLNASTFSANDGYIAAAQYKYIYVWNTSDWNFMRNISSHTDEILDIDFSPNGSWLASGGRDNVIKIWSTSDWNEITTLTEHTDDITCIKFSPDSKLLATGSKNGNVLVWSTSNWSSSAHWLGIHSSIRDIDFSADNGMLAIAYAVSDEIPVFSTETWQPVNSITATELEAWSLDFAPSGTGLAAGDESGKVYIWDSYGSWVINYEH